MCSVNNAFMSQFFLSDTISQENWESEVDIVHLVNESKQYCKVAIAVYLICILDPFFSMSFRAA